MDRSGRVRGRRLSKKDGWSVLLGCLFGVIIFGEFCLLGDPLLVGVLIVGLLRLCVVSGDCLLVGGFLSGLEWLWVSSCGLLLMGVRQSCSVELTFEETSDGPMLVFLSRFLWSGLGSGGSLLMGVLPSRLGCSGLASLGFVVTVI